MQYLWRARPQGLPRAIKYCGRCGRKTEFYCSNSFRVNAQKKTLDVWLIYKCEVCDATWNVELYSRVGAGTLEKGLYEGFLKNDAALAARYALDAAFLAKNGAEADMDALPFEVEGELPAPDTCGAQVVLECAFGARLDRLLKEKLCLSRAAVQRLMETGGIRLAGETQKGIKNLRVKGSVKITLSPAALLAPREAE
ncbi:MAG: DUF1062 domain-containing protein [Clostridiaceae bacterium]|nr:DUF1062 domain-containing protein [Eubacteriales bacterium]